MVLEAKGRTARDERMVRWFVSVLVIWMKTERLPKEFDGPERIWT